MNLFLKLLPSMLSTILATFSVAANPDWQWVRPQLQGNSLESMASSGTSLVAVGKKGMIVRSGDGGQWTISNSGTTEDLLDVVRWGDSFIPGTKRYILLELLRE